MDFGKVSTSVQPGPKIRPRSLAAPLMPLSCPLLVTNSSRVTTILISHYGLVLLVFELYTFSTYCCDCLVFLFFQYYVCRMH